jgi:serine/threonine-protein kinase
MTLSSRRGGWRRAATIGLAVALLAGCDSVWAQWRNGPERHGFNPDEATITPSNVASLVPKWSFAAPAGYVGPVTAAEDMLFVPVVDSEAYPQDGSLHALDAATGATVWSFDSDYVAEVSYAGGVVYFSSDDRHVYALDAATGAPVWRTPLLVNPGPATVVGDDVLFIDGDNYLYRLDRTTGAHRSAPVRIADQGRMAVDTADGDIYVVSVDDANTDEVFLHAYTAAGALRWTEQVPPTLLATPVVDGDRVYVRGQAYDANTGAVLWTDALNPYAATPALAHGNLYLARSFGLPVVALDPVTGAARWSSSIGENFPNVDDGVVVAGDIAWVVGDRRVKALDAQTGTVLWASDAATAFDESRMPVVAGGQVYARAFSVHEIVALGLP